MPLLRPSYNVVMSVKVDHSVLSLLDEIEGTRSGVLLTASRAAFSCASKACAPPPVGVGGSKSTGGSRARTAQREKLRASGGNAAVVSALRAASKDKKQPRGVKKGFGGSMEEAVAVLGQKRKEAAYRKATAKKGSSKGEGELHSMKDRKVEQALAKVKTEAHPRGKGEKFPKATLSKQPPPKHFDTVEEAAEYIRKNPDGNVTVPTDKVRTLVGEMKKMALAKIEELKKQGLSDEEAEKAGEINLCQVSVPGTNLFCNQSYDIPRLKMPQFGSTAAPGSAIIQMHKDGVAGVSMKVKNGKEEYNAQPLYEQHLKDRGIKITEKMMPADQLSASQVELKTTKVGGMADNPDFDPAGEAILVSRDGYIVDGHHRWSAQVVRDYMDGKGGDLPLKVKVIDMDILDILTDANNFADSIGLERKSA